uniref:Uncharacterized protein n=1 Tax=Aegilops tauschii subsp. strangulata TaxID=200361 RepID=A0A452XYC7_AEGTS
PLAFPATQPFFPTSSPSRGLPPNKQLASGGRGVWRASDPGGAQTKMQRCVEDDCRQAEVWCFKLQRQPVDAGKSYNHGGQVLKSAQIFASIGVLFFAETSTVLYVFATTVLYFAGTSVFFCCHRVFDLLEPALDFASLLPPWWPDAGTRTIFCFHRCFGFTETSVVFCIFCYHPFVFCWNQRRFLLPSPF